MPGISYYWMHHPEIFQRGITTTDIVLTVIVLTAMAVAICICTRL